MLLLGSGQKESAEGKEEERVRVRVRRGGGLCCLWWFKEVDKSRMLDSVEKINLHEMKGKKRWNSQVSSRSMRGLNSRPRD